MNETNNLLVLANANAFMNKILECIERRSLKQGDVNTVDTSAETTRLGAVALTRLIGGGLK